MAELQPKKIIHKSASRLLAPINRHFHALQKQLSVLESNGQEQYGALNKKLDFVHQQIQREIRNKGFLKLSETEILAKIFSGAKMYLDPRDVGLVPHLLLDGDWESEITQAWLKTVKQKDVVLDIGANFGYFGLLAAQQANRDCKVIMFEANPGLIPYLEKTTMVNSMQGCVSVENLAISDRRGSVTLNILKDYIASSSVQSVKKLNSYNQNGATFEIESSVDVPAVTIDEYCLQQNIKAINVIKMDIEGHEAAAYAGMRTMIQKSPDVTLFIEFTKQAYDDPRRFYEQMLEDFGSVYLITSGGVITKPKDSSYDAVIGSDEHWAMPVFSKKRFK